MNNTAEPSKTTIQPTNDSTSQQGRFIISGTLDFDTVPELMKQARPLFAAVDSVVIDFSGVENCNSAGLAIILEIARELRRHNKSVCLQSLPEQIRTFARAYSVERELSEAGLLC